MQMQVAIPPGVAPGQTFAIATPDGQQMQVQCPPDAVSGQTIAVTVPVPQQVVTAQAALRFRRGSKEAPPPPQRSLTARRTSFVDACYDHVVSCTGLHGAAGCIVRCTGLQGALHT